MQQPRISFLCATYNHGRYVESFLRSLCAQTVADWELILVDDCSTDNNRDVISAWSDPRVKLICHERNEGMAKSLQDAFLAASSPIVAWVASDDQLENGYVDAVLESFTAHRDADMVYTPLSYMNADGQLTGERSYLPVGKSRQRLVAEMFVGRNLLHSPGMAVRREVFGALLPLDIGMIQLLDWQIHLRLLERHNPVLLSEPVVRYRMSGGSACARSRAVEFREDAEYDNLMDAVRDFIGESVERFMEFFSDSAAIVPRVDEDVPFMLGLLALRSPIAAKRRWGFRMMMNAMSNASTAQGLYERHGIDYSRLMGFSAEASRKDDGQSDDSYAEIKRLRRRLRRYKSVSLGLAIVGLVAAGITISVVWR